MQIDNYESNTTKRFMYNRVTAIVERAHWLDPERCDCALEHDSRTNYESPTCRRAKCFSADLFTDHCRRN